MGRVQLSTAFGIDGPRRTTNLKYPEPPLYIEAPFDFDSDLDAPDTVHEDFLNPQEVQARNINGPVIAGQNRPGVLAAAAAAARNLAPSPIESDSSSSVTATTQPPTRVTSPIREDRGGAPSPSQRSASPVGSSILQLMEPLTVARANAMPAVNAVLAEPIPLGATTLVTRLSSIVRPHIASAVAPFLQHIPEVECFGHMFERSLVLELLSGRFSRNTILTALDAAVEDARSPLVTPTVEVVEEAASEFSDSSYDDFPGSESETDGRSPSPGSWSDRRRSAQPSPTLQQPTTTVDPALVPTAPSARPQVLDVDMDDDARSTSSSSATASSISAGPRYSMNSGIRNFTPRVFRSRDAVVRPQVIMDEVPGTNFHPVHQQRVLAPMR